MRLVRSAFLLSLAYTISASPEHRTVKVGLFAAAPLVFEKDGKPQGLFIDLIEHFSKTYNWHVDYVRGTWDDLQIQLKSGDIDILPALGYTTERTSIYDFNKNPMYIDNGVVFTSPKFNIHTIFDLSNKRVAGVKGSVFTTGFVNYINSFGIHCEIVYTTDNIQVMEAIVDGKADAGICVYSLGNELATKYPVVITPISFSPIALYFAVCKGTNQDLIAAINSQMAEMIVDPNSFYSESYYKWTVYKPLKKLPAWILWGIAGLLFLGLLLALWSFSLKRLVKIKTKHLDDEITERKLAVEALLQSQKRLELATESAHLGIWDWDIVNNRMSWDDQMFRLYGITEKPSTYGIELWQTSLHPDDAAFAVEEGQAAIHDGKKYDIEFRVKHPDGSIKYIKADGIVLRDNAGNAVRMLGINRDITDQKQAEEVRLKYEQQIQLNSKLDSLGILAGGIAHDFNNLMGGVFGYLEIALVKCTDAAVTKDLVKAANTIDRARALTQQLLTFAKGGIPIMKPGLLFPFVQETTQFALSGSNVSCRFDIPKDLWMCNFDKNQLGQVIDNLIINAKQAMPDGGTIEVAARNITLAEKEHPLLNKGRYIKISVKDNGIGISKEILPRIFDPFFTTKSKGYGLGLATCYSIINQHGGCIDVESEPGRGATFHFYLSASQTVVSTTEKPQEKTHTGNGVFLIMDDEEVMREIISDMLESFGYTVVCKDNGQDAVEFFTAEIKNNHRFSGMIFDLTIPGGVSGKTAVEQIRKIDMEIPVFVASGYADDPVIKDPARYGFTASICKPFRIAELSELLNTYVKPEN